MSGPRLLTINGMTVSYGSVTAVQNVTFTLDSGEVMALLGPNGAGKSSVLKGLAGIARASGTVEYRGQDLRRRATHRRAKDGICLVPQGRRVFADMTVEDNLLASVRAGRAERKTRLDGVWRHFPQLLERRHVNAGLMSGGEQQMLALGRALMSRPRILLLDEPSLGLAPKIVTMVFDRIREIVREQEVAVIIVDQNAVQAMGLAHKVCVVRHGELVYNRSAKQAQTELNIVHAHLGLSG
jgi:branched-chain amino acid transport system ATP-binding protein